MRLSENGVQNLASFLLPLSLTPSIPPSPGQSPLHVAAQAGHVPIIELLLQSGAVLDLNDASGMTPIHLASIVGAQETLGAMVKLAGGAVLSLPDASGVTPLNVCVCVWE